MKEFKAASHVRALCAVEGPSFRLAQNGMGVSLAQRQTWETRE